ncbi:MAG: type II toxin-antitoxin system RelE/ParE family toxin [Actinomycetota bacterium]|nr:type II toxin-antitoxin system RelE/ParE family toxin [Actinomycetota bacterium]
MTEQAYRVVFRSPARRAIADQLPEAVAAAVLEFCAVPLSENPHRVGKALLGPLAGLHGARRSTYRIVYLIDDEHHVVDVVDIAHRGDIYRRR